MKVESLKIRTALDYASGTADRDGATLDMSGFEWVIMIVKLAAVATSAVTSIKAQQGNASNLSDAEDLEGSGIDIADDDDNQVFAIAITKPRDRYVRVVVDKDGSNACAESAIYIQGNGRTEQALASITDEVTLNLLHSPAEGTA